MVGGHPGRYDRPLCREDILRRLRQADVLQTAEDMRLQKTTFRGVYDCSTHVRRGHGTCSSHLIRQDALHEKVFHAIRDQLQVALDYEKLLSACRGGAGGANIREKYNAAVSSVRLKLNALKKKRAGLYEDYAEGILNEEEYAFAKQTYEGQYEALSRLLDEAVERRERFLESISLENKWLTMMRGVAGETGLTQGLVDAVIEKVLVYGGGASRSCSTTRMCLIRCANAWNR